MLTKLMNCKHHHITLTLPKPYRLLAKINGNIFHNILFKAAANIINQWFIDTHNLKPGIVQVLHTAGADLKYHPHIHMIVSRGGQDINNQQFKFLKGKFLVKNEVFGKLLKAEFNRILIKLYRKGEIKVFNNINNLNDLKSWINKLNNKHWIVNIEEPLDDINHIIGYVGRYTKRACISEYKIEYIGQDQIKFRCNDYKNTPRGEKPKQVIISMKPYQFLDQLLQHVPSKRFKMVRYAGLYNSYHLNKIPQHLKINKNPKQEIICDESFDWGPFEEFRKAVIRAGKPDPFICKHCKQIKTFIAIQFPQKDTNNRNPIIYDSS